YLGQRHRDAMLHLPHLYADVSKVHARFDHAIATEDELALRQRYLHAKELPRAFDDLHIDVIARWRDQCADIPQLHAHGLTAHLRALCKHLRRHPDDDGHQRDEHRQRQQSAQHAPPTRPPAWADFPALSLPRHGTLPALSSFRIIAHPRDGWRAVHTKAPLR